MESLEQKVQRLLDIEEVKNMIATYARGADRNNDPEIMGPLFSPDAMWECEGFGRHEGRDEIARALGETGQNDITWTLHYMISPTVQINPDASTGIAHYYLWELANMRGESGNIEACWAGGTYDVELIKLEERWYFHRMRLNLKLVTPYDKGWKDGPIQSF